MVKVLVILFFSLSSFSEEIVFDLKEIIEYANMNNPQILINKKELEAESYNIKIENSFKYPTINFLSSASRYKFPYPITPISFEGGKLIIPDFDKSIYNLGFSLNFPLYKGGRIEKTIEIAGIKRNLKEISYKIQKRELEYAISILYFRILQLQNLKKAAEFSVEQMEIHKKNAESFYNAGMVPKIDLIKTGVELSRAKENLLTVNNNLMICFEVLKSVMGFEGKIEDIKLKEKEYFENFEIDEESALNEGYLKRLEIKEILMRKSLIEEKINFTKGKKLPEVYFSQDWLLSSGNSFEFEENYALSLKLIFPIYEGGRINFENKIYEIELEKIKEGERGLKIQIEKEIKEAILNFNSAKERISVLKGSIDEAKENLRIEQLLYESGSNTSKDVIDAENFYLQIETNYLNAFFDKNVSILNIYKAMGYDILDLLKGDLK